MKKQQNSHPENCKYCYLDLGCDTYKTNCGCGMKKCLYDCETEKEKDEWNDEM